MNNIVEFDKFESQLKKFKGDFDGIVYDLAIHEQDKQARSDRLTIGKVISALDAKHKKLKAPLKEKTDLIDSERKRIKDLLLGVQDKIKLQIKAHLIINPNPVGEIDDFGDKVDKYIHTRTFAQNLLSNNPSKE